VAEFGLPVEATFSRRPFAPISSQLYGAALPRSLVDCLGEGPD
jgi:hypothetical protein